MSKEGQRFYNFLQQFLRIPSISSIREWTVEQRLFLDLAHKHKRKVLETQAGQQEREAELLALEEKYFGVE